MKLLVAHHDGSEVAYRSRLISDNNCTNREEALKTYEYGRRLSNRIGNWKFSNRVGNLKCPDMEETLKIYK